MPQKPWRERQTYFQPEQTREEIRGHLRVIISLSAEANRKAALAFAARVLELPYQRVFAIFYGKAQRIEAHEADRVRAYVQRAEHLIEERAKLNAQIREFRAEAPAFMARLAPGPLPMETPPPLKRKGRK